MQKIKRGKVRHRVPMEVLACSFGASSLQRRAWRMPKLQFGVRRSNERMDAPQHVACGRRGVRLMAHPALTEVGDARGSTAPAARHRAAPLPQPALPTLHPCRGRQLRAASMPRSRLRWRCAARGWHAQPLKPFAHEARLRVPCHKLHTKASCRPCFLVEAGGCQGGKP
jgi:hypothetical protein